MLAQCLKLTGNLLKSPKMVHLFWVQNVQTSFIQDLCCYFKHTGLKIIFTSLGNLSKIVTC